MDSELFPSVQWEKTLAAFLPAGVPYPETANLYAALVFPCMRDQLFVACIVGRGWCIPGGRLEPGETAEVAVRREAFEEAGLALGPLHLLGHYLLRDEAGYEEI